jgi:heme/copper-type cytochrome/quinol oxidase subunit 1
MTTTTESPAATSTRVAPPAEEAPGLYRIVTSGDHKTVGRLYIAFSLIFGVASLVVGALVGFERVDTKSVSIFSDTPTYFQAFTFARVSLVFLVVLPLLVGLAIAVVPMQVGSPAIAFPRAAAASFWGWLVGSGVLIASYAIDGGLGRLGEAGTDPDAMALTMLALGMVVVSIVLAAVCLSTTVVTLRTAGMSLRRVPLFSWSVLVAASVWAVTLPVLLANLLLAYVDFRTGAAQQFGLPAAMYTNVSWAFRAPQVFAYVIPAIGIVCEIIPVAAKRRQRNHDVLLGALAVFGLLSAGFYAQTAQSQTRFVYVVAGLALLLPTLALLGGWFDTLVRGKLTVSAPFVLALVTLLLLVAAVATAALRVISSVDLLGTSATAGQMHLTLFAGLAGGIAGIVYWSPKLSGRTIPVPAALGIGVLVLLGAAAAGITDVISGILDQPDGINPGAVRDGVEALNLVSAIGIVVVGIAVVLTLLTYLRTQVGGVTHAPANPWGGHTLEWATVSPPPIGNFAEPLPEVRSERPLLDQTEEVSA